MMPLSHCPPRTGDDLTEYDTESDGNPTSILAQSITQIRASASDTLDIESLDLQELGKHAAEDQEYQVLKKTILSSFPNQKASLKGPIEKF